MRPALEGSTLLPRGASTVPPPRESARQSQHSDALDNVCDVYITLSHNSQEIRDRSTKSVDQAGTYPGVVTASWND